MRNNYYLVQFCMDLGAGGDGGDGNGFWTAVNASIQGLLCAQGPEVDLVRLDELQVLLQSGRGKDDDWMAVVSAHDFALLGRLLALCVDDNHTTCAASSRCLAFAGNVYRRMWIHYMVDDAHLEAVCRVSQVAVQHCLRAVRSIREDKLQPGECRNYLGFDERDVAQYNLTIDYRSSLDGRRLSTHGIAGMEEVGDAQASILVWLLLLFQFYSEKSNYLSAVLRGHAQVVQECESVGIDPPSCIAFSTFVVVSECLLRSCTDFSEDAYLQAIRVIAAMNRHCVACPSEDGTTLVAKRCSQVHGGELPIKDAAMISLPNGSAGTDPGSPHIISEGLLHLLNDCGYPAHTAPETLPVLQLCADLISHVCEHNIFYTNDLRVCTDIVVRELTNISTPIADTSSIGGSESHNEDVRVLYLRLISAMMSYHVRKQLPAEELYRGEELRSLVAVLATADAMSPRTWSREEAEEVLQLWQ